MAEINIGILIPPSKWGGVFQYALSIADALINYSDKFNYIIIHKDIETVDMIVKTNSKNVHFVSVDSKESSLSLKLRILSNLILNYNIFKVRRNNETKILKDYNIGLLIIPYPSLFGHCNNIPYIVSIPDTMHRYYSNFPEYPLKERLLRDLVYKNVSEHSVLTIVDAHHGADDLNKFFGISKQKIRVIPYIPPGYIFKHKDMDLRTAGYILQKYNLPEYFLFYPAQFWYHKNHLALLKSIHYIGEEFKIKIPLVLSGTPKENYNETINLIKNLNMQDQILNLGYVTDIEVVALYKKAVALVFPSLFGPTNIPPLEAMVLGTPVVCSDLFSMPEQIGNAGLLFNPFDVKDMALKIHRIWTDEKLRSDLRKRGYKKVKDLTLENYARQWEKIIEEAMSMAAL